MHLLCTPSQQCSANAAKTDSPGGDLTWLGLEKKFKMTGNTMMGRQI